MRFPKHARLVIDLLRPASALHTFARAITEFFILSLRKPVIEVSLQALGLDVVFCIFVFDFLENSSPILET